MSVFTPCRKPGPGASPREQQHYERHKEASRRYEAKKSLEGRDIGDIPAVVDPERRELCRFDLKLYCKTYYPQVFKLPFSADHDIVIAHLQKAILEGGVFAVAMPRAGGKSTLCEAACLWAAKYGHRAYIILIGANDGKACERLEGMKTQLLTNDLLLQDFPEVCYPIRCMEGMAQRCKGQRHYGKATHIAWKTKQVIFPTIPGSAGSGAIIQVTGLLGSGIRGPKHTRPDGETVRPDLAIPDDPQTDASAHSVSQCEKREAVINGAVLGMAGPGKTIAVIMPVTVIRIGDVADRFLNRDIYPEWNGIRTSLVYEWPTNEELWHKYADIRRESFRRFGDHRLATDFYAANRAEMDAGAKVAWPERFNEDELSAVQYAWNLRLKLKAQFFAEYQNQPENKHLDGELLQAGQIVHKMNGYERGVIPQGCQTITGFTDVHDGALYYELWAWEPDFTGYLIDVGTFPDQKTDYFTLSDLRYTLQQAAPPGSQKDAAIFWGLKTLTDDLLERSWKRDGDGHEMQVDMLLVDAGYKSKIVRTIARQSKHRGRILPSLGRGVKAKQAPMEFWPKANGEHRGAYWTIPPLAAGSEFRHVIIDVNAFKSLVHQGLATPLGDRGCLSLFQAEDDFHRMFAEHCDAEYRTKVTANGRTVDEWQVKPGRPDNHLFDCAVGSAAAAAIKGVTQVCHQSPPKRKLIKRRRGGRSYQIQ